MSSKLIITSVEDLEKEIHKKLKNLQKSIGIYISLNKTEKEIHKKLKDEGINTDKIFFIDTVTVTNSKDDVLYLRPELLEKIFYIVKGFSKEIKGEKYIIIDSLSTLLIYNSEIKVANFIKKIIEENNEKSRIFAYSPETKGEEQLNKIDNLFEKVMRK